MFLKITAKMRIVAIKDELPDHYPSDMAYMPKGREGFSAFRLSAKNGCRRHRVFGGSNFNKEKWKDSFNGSIITHWIKYD